MNPKQILLPFSRYRQRKLKINYKKQEFIKQPYIPPELKKLSQNDLSLAYSFKSNDLVELIKVNKMQNNGSYREFRQIKFREIIYAIGETVLIRNLDDETNDFIAKIKKIILLNNDGKLKPALYLQWDLPPKFDLCKECISDNEVFLTQETDYTIVDCLNGKCDILTYDEYDQQTAIKQNSVFFSRANYDARKLKIINPPFEKWEKHCICQKPFNPDLPYVCCDVCEKWFHIECLKLTLEQAKNIDFVCKNCESYEKSYSLEEQQLQQQQLLQ